MKKGGKTAEKDGLWKLSSKSCQKHVQKILSQILICLVVCFPCRETLLRAAIQVSQCRCKPTLEICNYENIYIYIIYRYTIILYCRACFLHCFSCSVYYIGKSWEILNSMCGRLSGGLVSSCGVIFASGAWGTFFASGVSRYTYYIYIVCVCLWLNL